MNVDIGSPFSRMKALFNQATLSQGPPPAPFISVAGTDSLYFQLVEGYVSKQEWEIAPYTLQLIQAVAQENLAFEIRHQGASEILAISIGGRCELSVFPDSVTILPSDCFQFYHTPNFQAFANLLTHNKIVSLILIEHAADNKDEFVDRTGDYSPTLMPVAMVEILERILYASYSVPKHFHQEEIESLLQRAHETKEKLVGSIHFNETDIDSLHLVKNWLDKNLDKTYSVSTLMEIAAVPIKKLNHGFFNLFGDTPYHYFREKKLSHAHKKIEESNSPIKQIARQIGYHTNSNFSVAFKNKFGYTPASLRKNNR